MTDFSTLSVDELVAQQKALAEQLAARQTEIWSGTVEKIRQLIEDTGVPVTHVIELIAPKKRARKPVPVSYVDPNNPENTYKRGVLPGWMKEAMVANNLDPEKAEDRETYKTNFLKKVD